MKILVIKSGSSSVKYQLFDMQSETVLTAGRVERIGEAQSQLVHHWYDAQGESEVNPHANYYEYSCRPIKYTVPGIQVKRWLILGWQTVYSCSGTSRTPMYQRMWGRIKSPLQICRNHKREPAAGVLIPDREKD